ncbi:pyruvate kinase [Clostridium sp.]|uniref:pyruvate kinase n=1 Tax=Clostridium sp. TaxID=1506 RepID=UPI0026018ACC|nr:pyruvate kinase [Clostridium sp.]
MDIIGSINTRFISKNEQGKKEIISKINNIALSGANIIRMNLSHSKHEDVLFCINYIRYNHKDIRILLDLQGNKVRVSNLLKETFKVMKEEIVYFCSEDAYEIYKNNIYENNKLIPLNIKNKFIYNKKFKKIFMKDATMEFGVISNNNGLIKTKVKLGGVVRSEKGCNLPLLDRKEWGVTDKDKKDISFALNNGIDIIAYSYCSYVDECREFKNYVFRNVNKNQVLPKLWGKIETNDGLNNIKDIAEELDGIVIARGDLSAEIGIKNVPIAQEKILYTLKKQKKEVIVATNVLGSMNRLNIKNPTINELSDIYNLIKHGATGFMLTGETSTGKNEKEIVLELKYVTDYYYKLIKKLKK